MSLIPLALALALAGQAEPSGIITGVVMDASGAPLGGVEVVLTLDATGYPVSRGRSVSVFAPLEDDRGSDFGSWWTSTSGPKGTFSFEGVTPGAYRVVAQSWEPGSIEQAGGSSRGIPRSMLPASAVNLCGAARVSVASGAAQKIELRPLGESAFTYGRGASNDDWYLVVSLSPPSADPILGFVGWRGPFVRDAIAFVRLDGGRCTVRGLPAKELHYAVFANDSVPGFAAGRLDGKFRHLKTRGPALVSGWSKATLEPPENLTPLVVAVRSLRAKDGRQAVYKRLAIGREEAWKRADAAQATPFQRELSTVKILGPLSRRVALSDGGTEHSVADLLAADAYARAAEHREAMKERDLGQ